MQLKGIKMPEEMIKAIEEKAKQENRSFSNMVKVLLTEALEARQN